MPSRFEKFSERARKVLAIAQEEAQRFNHSYIGTEHILLGLSRGPEGIASRVLEVLGIDGKRIRTAVEFIVSQDDSPKREDVGLTDRAKKVIELVGLEGREENYPSQLSGGQQQRVGIARSLIVEPDVWFLDEPFPALDPLIRRQMQDEFMKIQSVLNKSIVFITHDFVEALRIADRMAIMRDGFIVQFGRPIDIVMNPVDEYVRDFTGDVPFERFLKAEDLIEKSKSSTDKMKIISRTTPIQEILPQLADSKNGLAVVDDKNKELGIITPQGVINVMASAGSKKVQNKK